MLDHKQLLIHLKHSSIRTVFAVALVMFMLPLQADESSDKGLALLMKMGDAANELDYKGEFVVVKNGQISSMKIVHSLTDAGSKQILMSLSGSKREIIQSDDQVACVLPDQGIGVKEKKQSTQLPNIGMSENVEGIAQNYKIAHIGQGRVASRSCERVDVTPNDDFRYGYLLCIDTETQLLLKSELTDSTGKILESYMFVDVEFGEVEPEIFVSQTKPQTLDWMDDKPVEGASMNGDSAPKWQVSDNITGFKVEHSLQRISPLMKVDVTHLVLGDGLAKVSVFVSDANASVNKAKEAMSMGSINSFTREVDNYMVTAIGEVPQQTVAMIAEHTELVDSQ